MQRLENRRASGARNARVPRDARSGSAWRVALRALALLAAAAPVAAQELEQLHLGARTIELALHPDRVGLVLHARDEPGVVQELLGRGFDEVRGWGELVRVLDPLGKPERGELAALSLRLSAEKGVAFAGLLATPAGATEPLLLPPLLVAGFDPSADDAAILALVDAHGLRLVKRSRFRGGAWLLALRAGSGADVLAAARALAGEPLVEYAEPDLVQATAHTSADPDPLLLWQWHHQNVGQVGGTRDADIDTLEAWTLTRGAGVVIAVVEDGFDVAHPDLVANLWTDPESGAHGWNFSDDDAVLEGPPGDHESCAHGTAVAGCAAARGDNGIGGSGSCPECSLMLVRGGYDSFGDSEAIRFAAAKGADVIVCSWTYPRGQPVPEAVRRAFADAAELGRGGLGCVLLFAVRNEDVDVDLLHDLAALPEGIAVGSVTNTDQRTSSCGKGRSLSVLGPSRLNQAPNQTEGTLNVTTTDWCGHACGYNADPALAVAMDALWMPCAELADTSDYTACFGGTSAATPIVGGVAGLVLSLAPELERTQVKRLLQDTTDRVEDSLARYDEEQGASAALTHGYGRVNAWEALRVVAPPMLGGGGGVDLVLRDNRLDWGNTEQASSTTFERERGVIGHWRSPDVKIDAPPFAALPADARAFAELASEAPLAGVVNRVYVRLRNRGPRAAKHVSVELAWALGGPTLPPLPADFWESFPHDSGSFGAWSVLGTRTLASLPYCGASVAGSDQDAAAVFAFELEAPALEGLATPALGLLALAACDEDEPSGATRSTRSVDAFVPEDNDVALRCALLRAEGAAAQREWTLLVRNPTESAIQTCLELIAPSSALLPLRLPEPAPSVSEHLAEATPTSVTSPLFPLAAGAVLEIQIRLEDDAGAGPFELRQWQDSNGFRSLLGGLVLER